MCALHKEVFFLRFSKALILAQHYSVILFVSWQNPNITLFNYHRTVIAWSMIGSTKVVLAKL